MEKDRRRFSIWMWLFFGAAVGVSGTVWFLANGSKGNEIAENVGAGAALVSVVLSIAGLLRVNAPRRRTTVDPPARWPWVALGVVLALSAGAATWLGWSWADRDNLNVTADMAPSIDAPLADSGTMTLTVPGSPPKRTRLALTLTLANAGTVGNCVKPAKLLLTPRIDGEMREPVTAGSDVEVELSVRGTRHVAVIVELEHPDPACSVLVKVSRAILFN